MAILEVLVSLFTIASSVYAQDYDGGPCCASIAQNIPGRVISPSVNAYQEEKNSYWSALAGSPNPLCFVRPRTAFEVSTILQILNQPQWENTTSCRFAIRSGGHTTWAANNINGGVVLDLTDLNEVRVDESRNTVSLGPGNRWNRVYEQLEPLGIAISGGRWGNVGVGGLLTGGGLSFFQGTRGPSCDGIVNHEVVLSNGSILNTNTRDFPDLHRALKGGNNNFGIVTRFDVQAWPQGQIWYAQIMGQPGRLNIPMRWFEQFASHQNRDQHGQIMFYTILAAGTWSHRAFVTYSQPQAYPKLFEGLVEKSVQVTEEVTTLGIIAQMNADSSLPGTRSSFATFTYINRAEYMDRLLDVATDFSKSLPAMSSLNLIFQPLWTAPRMASFNISGGNSFGLENVNDDLVIGQLHTIWGSAASDYQVRTAERTFLANAKALAEQMGVHHPFLYANYAEEFQDVMASYGAQNLETLRKVSLKYDKSSLFQRQLPGGFKLWPRTRYEAPAPQQSSRPRPPTGLLSSFLAGLRPRPGTTTQPVATAPDTEDYDAENHRAAEADQYGYYQAGPYWPPPGQNGPIQGPAIPNAPTPLMSAVGPREPVISPQASIIPPNPAAAPYFSIPRSQESLPSRGSASALKLPSLAPQAKSDGVAYSWKSPNT